MKFITTALLLALTLTPAFGQLAPTAGGGGVTPSPPKVGRAPLPTVVLTGYLHDAGGVWVTDFVLLSGVVVTVPHDPALGDLILVTVPNGPTLFLDIDSLGDFLDNDDDWVLPVIAGSGQCWLIPYGPPNPDGTLPLQPSYTTFTGHGLALSTAIADYHAQVAAAIAGGAKPAPELC